MFTHLLESMHCSLVEPCSLRRVIVCIAGWRRNSGVVAMAVTMAVVVAVAGGSVKVHGDRG